MKILIVSQYFWPENFRINGVAKALHRAGCEVTVLTGQPNYPEGRIFAGYRAWRTDRELHPSGFQILRAPLFPRFGGNVVTLSLNFLSFIASSIFFGYWRLYSRQFDIVFVYGTSPILQGLTGAFFSAIKRAPLVLWVQDLWPESLFATGYVTSPFILNRMAGIVGWIYRRCDLLLVPSRQFVGHTSTKASDVPVVYFPNPGDVEDNPPKPPEIPVILPRGFNVTFSGNLGRVQSLETIVETATRLRAEPDINFVIFGNGSRFGWIEQEIKRRSLTNVFLFGRVDSEVANDAMARSGALLITLKDIEGLTDTVPSKLSTYFGVGRPIIACMKGEGADLVRASGAGLICEPESDEELARAILQLKALPSSERDAMGAAGRRWYEQHFHPQHLTDQLIGHFRQVTEWHGSTPANDVAGEER